MAIMTDAEMEVLTITHEIDDSTNRPVVLSSSSSNKTSSKSSSKTTSVGSTTYKSSTDNLIVLKGDDGTTYKVKSSTITVSYKNGKYTLTGELKDGSETIATVVTDLPDDIANSASAKYKDINGQKQDISVLDLNTASELSGSANDYLSTLTGSGAADDPDTISDLLATDNMNGIFGLPYQFLESVDRRVPGTEIGRKYAEKIIARLPLLFIAPGKQVFMEGYSDEVKGSMIASLASSSKDSDMSSLISDSGQYYSFEYDYSEYYTYLNPMCWAVAEYMGIGDYSVTIGGTNAKLSNYDWSNATSDKFKSFFSSEENLIFYLDSMTSVQESFQNTTTESALASTLNSFSDTAKEIQFILGGTDSAISKLMDNAAEAVTTAMNSLSDIIEEIGGGMVSSICETGITTIVSGGKLIFPEIWSDFAYDRSYSLDIKLRSPDHDDLSIYLNVLVPYMALLCLVMPKEVTDRAGTVDPNGYGSPFLVKAFCKGMFSVDMGLVIGLSATKGAECCWNDDGLPTQMDISLEIKDLYTQMFISSNTGKFPQDSIKNIVENTAMMDYLANLAGLNLGQMSLGRRVTMWYSLTKSTFMTTPSRIWTRFDNAITNIMYSMYRIL